MELAAASAASPVASTVPAMDDLNLSDLRSAHQVLQRTPLGESVAELAERIGLITENVHRGSVARRQFQSNVSRLSPPQLSDEQSYWASEYGRVVELIGILQGQEKYLSLRSKAARAQARARLRRTAESDAAVSKLTSAQVADAAEEDPVVCDLDERSAIVAVLLASALAAKDATTVYLQTLSREITFRCAQMDARLH
jgi:hypothetical protein